MPRSASTIGIPVIMMKARTEYLMYFALFASFSLPGLRARAIKMKMMKVKVMAVKYVNDKMFMSIQE